MSNRDAKIEKHAAETVVDEIVNKNLKKKEDSDYYWAYLSLFKKWHKEFIPETWDAHIDAQIKDL